MDVMMVKNAVANIAMPTLLITVFTPSPTKVLISGSENPASSAPINDTSTNATIGTVLPLNNKAIRIMTIAKPIATKVVFIPNSLLNR